MTGRADRAEGADTAERPRRRPGGRTARVREKTLKATLELVARHGVDGFRYEQVAELAGVHKTSVYRNWPDRDQLVSEALLQVGERESPVEDTGDLRRDLAGLLVSHSVALLTPTGVALQHALQPGAASEAVKGVLDAYYTERVAAVRERVEGAADEERPPPGVDTGFLLQMLSGPVHFHRFRTGRPLPRAEAERIVDVVLAGLRATAEREDQP
ncbi:TetR/AcrR family transcriptional regulator C-terminal ligand-binding domain-containing protein [Streptomyces sp. NPDC048172]|uniref:TetR/AcrR family transcriptional regulator n=1 Tax=Streptomyces sp. NPDC048172 TaxID=3365505 RepID=UPI0037111A1B